MLPIFKQVVDAVQAVMVDEYGFRRKRADSTREDGLLRAVVPTPGKFARSDDYRFNFQLHLGIPGLSTRKGQASQWMTTAMLSKPPGFRHANNPDLVLSGDAGDAEILAYALSSLRTLCDEFLVRYETPDDLLGLVADNPDEWRRLELEPFNVVGRLQQAAVYAAYLGQRDRAEALKDQTVDYALNNNIAYAVPRVESAVAAMLRGEVPKAYWKQ